MGFPFGKKYGNKRQKFDGYSFDSQKELDRYLVLKARLAAGQIKDLEIHPKFVLLEGFECQGKRYAPVTFNPDFRYFDLELGKRVVEDVKARFKYKTKKLRIHKEKPFVTEQYTIKIRFFLRDLPPDTVFMEVY